MTSFNDIPIDVLFPSHIVHALSSSDFANLQCVNKELNKTLQPYKHHKLLAEWDSICKLPNKTQQTDFDIQAILTFIKTEQKTASRFFDGSLILTITPHPKDAYHNLMCIVKLSLTTPCNVGLIYLIFDYIASLISVGNTSIFHDKFKRLIYTKAEELEKETMNKLEDANVFQLRTKINETMTCMKKHLA